MLGCLTTRRLLCPQPQWQQHRGCPQKTGQPLQVHAAAAAAAVGTYMHAGVQLLPCAAGSVRGGGALLCAVTCGTTEFSLRVFIARLLCPALPLTAALACSARSCCR
jgi:hypothetical protein